MDIKRKFVLELLAKEKYDDLIKLLTHVPFVGSDIDDEFDYPEELDQIVDLGLLAVKSVHRMQFIIENGTEKDDYCDDTGYIHFSCKKEFKEWMDLGAPTISLSQIKLYKSGIPFKE